MHKENFLSSWPREDGNAGWMKEAREDESKDGKREVERRGEDGDQRKVS